MMKALSIRQPWAWLIVNGHKDIENRGWPTNYRGNFLVHASKGCTNLEYEDACEFVQDINPAICLPPLHRLERGGIVGMANLTDCVQAHSSPWFVGPHGFVVTNAYPLPFRPLPGMLGFFSTEPLPLRPV